MEGLLPGGSEKGQLQRWWTQDINDILNTIFAEAGFLAGQGGVSDQLSRVQHSVYLSYIILRWSIFHSFLLQLSESMFILVKWSIFHLSQITIVAAVTIISSGTWNAVLTIEQLSVSGTGLFSNLVAEYRPKPIQVCIIWIYQIRGLAQWYWDIHTYIVLMLTYISMPLRNLWIWC